jgi:hypothetical protein
MGTVSKLIITTLLAWAFIVGPLAAVTAGISLVRSFYPASALTKRPDNSVGAREFRGPVAEAPAGLKQQITLMSTALALLKPVAVDLPAGNDGPAYVRDAINWQFDGAVCNQVVGLDHPIAGLVVARCDSGEKFLLMATAVTGRRSVLRCTALPKDLAEAAPGCR